MRRFDSPAPVSAVLDIPAGRIRFIAADRADAMVEALPVDASKGCDITAAEQTEVEYGDGVLRIEVSPANNRISTLSDPSRRRSNCPRAPASRRRRPAPSSGASSVSAAPPSRARRPRSGSTRPPAPASPSSPATSRSAAWAGPRIGTQKGGNASPRPPSARSSAHRLRRRLGRRCPRSLRLP